MIAVFDELPSTSDYLREHTEFWRHNYYAVCARSQTAGRGRHTKIWQMQAGQDLAFTMVYHFNGAIKHIGGLTPYIGYALSEILAPLTEKQLLLKWPNDILSAGKKLCGILCEYVGKLDNNVNVILVGVGINGNSDASLNDAGAVSLKELSGMPLDIDTLRTSVIGALAYRLRLLRIPYEPEFCAAWYRACAHPQALVSWQAESGQIRKGNVSGIDAEGRLLLQDSAGQMHAVAQEIEWG